jgi:hypothetical protein
MVSISASTESNIDWNCTMEWSALHLAVKQDVESLKLLLYTIQHRLGQTAMDRILEHRDSR